MKRCSRFTLIELLVVLAVLSLLLTLVMKAVAGVQMKAYRIQCLSNLRQIGISLLAYPQTNDGYMAPADLGGEIDSWINLTAADLSGGHDVFKCPSMSSKDCFNPYGGNSPRYNAVKTASYVMNCITKFNWSSATLPYDPAHVSGWCDGTTVPVHGSKLLQPSSSIYVCDALKGLFSGDARGIVSYSETDRGIDAGLRDVGTHHEKGFNTLMGDGHGEYFIQTLPEQWPAARF